MIIGIAGLNNSRSSRYINRAWGNMHRKIYEDHFGSIPKDDDGRSYEIHHIDGNHSNNDPTNLKCVTIQEHYDIHYSQGDWSACQLILTRMAKTPDEISEECSRLVKQRINEGKMPWLASDHARARELDKVRLGKHPWQGKKGSELATRNNLRRADEGTNPFAGEPGSKLSKQIQLARVGNGTHNFSGAQGSIHSTKLNLRLLEEGRHPSQNPESMQKLSTSMKNLAANGNHPAQIAIRNGTHPSQQKWTCPHCSKEGKGMSNAKRYHFDNCKNKGE